MRIKSNIAQDILHIWIGKLRTKLSDKIITGPVKNKN